MLSRPLVANLPYSGGSNYVILHVHHSHQRKIKVTQWNQNFTKLSQVILYCISCPSLLSCLSTVVRPLLSFPLPFVGSWGVLDLGTACLKTKLIILLMGSNTDNQFHRFNELGREAEYNHKAFWACKWSNLVSPGWFKTNEKTLIKFNTVSTDSFCCSFRDLLLHLSASKHESHDCVVHEVRALSLKCATGQSSSKQKRTLLPGDLGDKQALVGMKATTTAT